MELPKFKIKELNNTFVLRKKESPNEYLKWCNGKFIFTTLHNSTLFSLYNASMLTDKLKQENLEFLKLQIAVQEYQKL